MFLWRSKKISILFGWKKKALSLAISLIEKILIRGCSFSCIFVPEQIISTNYLFFFWQIITSWQNTNGHIPSIYSFCLFWEKKYWIWSLVFITAKDGWSSKVCGEARRSQWRQKGMKSSPLLEGLLFPKCNHWILRPSYISAHLGPVVQSALGLTSLFRVISLTVLADSIYNILIFLDEKMWVAFALQKLLTFFQQKISAYLRITQCKF